MGITGVIKTVLGGSEVTEQFINPNEFLRQSRDCLTYEDCQHIFFHLNTEMVMDSGLLKDHMAHVRECSRCQQNFGVVFSKEKECDLASIIYEESIHTSCQPPLLDLTVHDGEPVFADDDIVN